CWTFPVALDASGACYSSRNWVREASSRTVALVAFVFSLLRVNSLCRIRVLSVPRTAVSHSGVNEHQSQSRLMFRTGTKSSLSSARTTSLPVEVRAHNINKIKTASLFEALHAQGETLDGYNIHCAINDELHAGAIAGYPMQDIRVSVYDGKHHPVDSKEVAFRAAGKWAFIDAVQKAKPVLLEPMVDMEITVPASFMGDIASDLSGRRGRIQGQDMLPGNMCCVKAQAPLAEVMQYNSQLRSVTGGQGSYTMELSHYEPVPGNVQQHIIAASQKAKDEK
ncbi:hypothetical protein LCGC14_2867230, partial [marine sediment metagenome]